MLNFQLTPSKVTSPPCRLSLSVNEPLSLKTFYLLEGILHKISQGIFTADSASFVFSCFSSWTGITRIVTHVRTELTNRASGTSCSRVRSSVSSQTNCETIGIKTFMFVCLCLYELELTSSSLPAKATNLSKKINVIVYNAGVFVLIFVIKNFCVCKFG